MSLYDTTYYNLGRAKQVHLA
eukprot:COSAG06_NODE_57177_length_281_cov_0.857143_1_plen_20_part_10